VQRRFRDRVTVGFARKTEGEAPGLIVLHAIRRRMGGQYGAIQYKAFVVQHVGAAATIQPSAMSDSRDSFSGYPSYPSFNRRAIQRTLREIATKIGVQLPGKYRHPT